MSGAPTEDGPPLPPYNSTLCFFDSPRIFDLVVEHLDAADCTVVSLTCRSLQSRFSKAANAPQRLLRERLSRIEYLAFLSTIARDLPNEYVCQACAQLHRVLSTAEGHARDARVVKQMSNREIGRVTAERALGMPCQRRQPGGIVQSKYWQADVDGECYYVGSAGSYDGHLHTFTGALTGTPRVPLSGLLHRDVQLVLKRIRLLDSHAIDDPTRARLEQAIRAALQPFSVERLMEKRFIYNFSHRKRFNYRFEPRVITDAHNQRRFLMKTVVEKTIFNICEMPFCICPHQLMKHNDWGAWTQALFAAWGKVVPPEMLEPTFGRDKRPRAFHGISTPALARAVRPHELQLASLLQCIHEMETKEWRHVSSIWRMLERCIGDPDLRSTLFSEEVARREQKVPGYEFSGSCHRCPTDFHVYETRDMRLTKSVWQDFGPEAPVTDELWQSHLPGLFLQAELGKEPYTQPNTWQSGPTVAHREGSVREAFETAPSYV